MHWNEIIILIVIFIVILGLGVIYLKKKYPLVFSYVRIMNFPINRRIKKFAKDKDFIYLKNVYLQIDEKSFVKIDGVLIGEKYVYTLAYRHFKGVLQANSNDAKWLLRTPSALYVDNPLIAARFKIDALAQLIGTVQNNIVNIILVGNKVEFSEKLITNSEREIVTATAKVLQVIKSCEKFSPLNNIADDEMERVANVINNENKSCRKLNRKLR